MVKQKYTDEELLLDYLRACNKAGKWLNINNQSGDSEKITNASNYTYYKRFVNIYNVRKLILDKYSERITFRTNLELTRWDKFSNEEILRAIITKSLDNGYKLEPSDIKIASKLPHYPYIYYRIGGVEKIHQEASKLSEDFAKLPTKDRCNERKTSIAKEYADKCLAFGVIIGVGEGAFKKYNLGSYRNIYRYFNGIADLRNYCAELSPEFAELLANSPDIIKK